MKHFKSHSNLMINKKSHVKSQSEINLKPIDLETDKLFYQKNQIFLSGLPDRLLNKNVNKF